MNIKDLAALAVKAAEIVDYAKPIFDLAIRVYVAKVFFLSGLVKIQSWDSTLALFENEYAVPLLPPDIAAYMGTAAELCLPPLLVLGIGGRAVALRLDVRDYVYRQELLTRRLIVNDLAITGGVSMLLPFAE